MSEATTRVRLRRKRQLARLLAIEAGLEKLPQYGCDASGEMFPRAEFTNPEDDDGDWYVSVKDLCALLEEKKP